MAMLRRALPAVLAAALLAGLPAGPVAAAPAPDNAKHCGLIAKGNSDYRVKTRKLKCRFARRWVKRYMNKGRVADGFSCIKTGIASRPFYCTKGPVKAYWAEKL
jgi:hypothetical protein